MEKLSQNSEFTSKSSENHHQNTPSLENKTPQIANVEEAFWTDFRVFEFCDNLRRGAPGRIGEPALPPMELALSKADLRPIA